MPFSVTAVYCSDLSETICGLASRRFLRFAYIRQDQLRRILTAKVDRMSTTIEFMFRPWRRPSRVLGNAVILAAHTQGDTLARSEINTQGPDPNLKLDNSALWYGFLSVVRMEGEIWMDALARIDAPL